MTTLVSTNQTVTAFVAVGRVLTVTAAADGSGFVRRYKDGSVLDSTALASDESATFGPYVVPMECRISCGTGSMSYDETDSTTAVGGGGAANFVDLNDTPDTLIANALLTANAAGDELVSVSWATFEDSPGWRQITAIVENVGGGAYIIRTADGGASGQCQLYAGDAFAEITGSSGATTGGVYVTGTTVSIGALSGTLIFLGIPTSDPGVLNAPWCDTAAGRVIKLSAGV